MSETEVVADQLEGRTPITEDDNVHQQWYEDARTQTIDTLPAFIDHLMNDYHHDYGTICHAAAAGMIGTFGAINKNPHYGGLTGFQAGAVFWQLFRELMGETGPASIVRYNDMLYPQYEQQFDKVITSHTWKYLQEEARKNLENRPVDSGHVHPGVFKHWQSIVDGVVPFGYRVEESDND